MVERAWGENPKLSKYCRLYCVLIYLIFIGLRGYIGTDWYNYQLIFNNTPALFSEDWRSFWSENRLEPGFIGFVSTMKSVWNNYYFFVFINSCIDVSIVHIFLKKYVDWYTLGFLIFFVMGGLTLSELMRNMRGICIFMLSIKYLSERKPLPYFMLNGLGMLFHWTSLFFLPLYFILHIRWNRSILFVAFIIVNIIFLYQIEFLRPTIEWAAEKFGGRTAYLFTQYLLNEAFSERYVLSIGYFERVLTTLLILIFWGKLHRKRNTNTVFINIYTLYIFSFFFLSEIRELAARASLLFIFSYWVLIPALFNAIITRWKRRLFIISLYIYCLLKINGLTSLPLYRYDNHLWGIERYERRVRGFDHFYQNR